MSLVQHVSALEGVDRTVEAPEDDLSVNGTVGHGSIKRKISYDVFPQPVPVIEDVSTTAPYKVSSGKRLGMTRRHCRVLSASNMTFQLRYLPPYWLAGLVRE